MTAQKISQMLYFLLFMTLAVYIIVALVSGKDVAIPTGMLAIFSLCLLPVIDALYNALFSGAGFASDSDRSYQIGKFIDSRVFFAGALIVFCYVIFFLILGDSGNAESLSIYAYYLLIAGVMGQIVVSLVSKNSSKQ